MATRRAFILAGTGSGCGKTTVTLGLLSLLQQRGMRVQPCKVGPDYLDTAWHTAISGIASRNLDSFMLPAPILNALFTEQLQQADIAVIEGVMGLYDGYGTDPNYCSSAAMAKQLGCPVILLVDGKAVSTSIAATVMGFQHFDPALDIAGVIVNRVNSDAHFQLLKSAIERYCRVPVLGYVPRVEGVALPERHLGLVTARESVVNQQAWRDFASLLGRTLDIDRLLSLSELAAMPIGEWGEQLAADAGEGLTLALADDEAFNFYYPDNLALLARCGVKMVRFSPLRDRQLPACQMIWLGGGYPELYAAQLSENRSMCSSVRAALEANLPCIAECGGFMYLTEAIGEHPMVGFLPGRCFDAGKLARFGYVTLTAERDNLLCRAGGSIPAHEFHHWDAEQTGDAFTAAKPFGRSWPCVFATDTLYAGYPHFHFYANPSFAVRFLDACRKGKHHAGTDQTDGH